MARLLGIRIRNYRALANFGLGQTDYGKGEPLPRLVCLIGPNGAGKSTVLDAFGFVADCLLEGVESACDKPHRGGFERLRTQASGDKGSGDIGFEIFFEADDPDRPIVYHLAINLRDSVPIIVAESLRQRQQGETRGKPYYFLKLKDGKGAVWAGQAVDKASVRDKQKIHLADPDKLGIATLGNLSEHPRIIQLRSYIEQWYLSYFVPEAARIQPPSGAQRWLDRTGSNVANVLQYYKRQQSGAEFKSVLVRLASAIPGLVDIDVEESKDKRLLLKFDERGYQDPFYQQSMSDGTLKMLAYAILLEDPAPRPLIGIEEPENGLYVRLVERLASQFVARADRKPPTQILVTTHSPYFVDALSPSQVWLIRKDQDGHSQAISAASSETIQAMTKEGIPLGSLWYSNHLDDGAPE